MYLLGLVSIMSFLVMSAMKGYVMSACWGWFIAPTFNLAPLPIVAAMGVIVVTDLLRTRGGLTISNVSLSDIGKELSHNTMASILAYGAGWLVKGLM